MTRRSDTDQGWIKRRFLKLEKQIREDRAARRLESATIGKGGVTVKGGGGIKVLYPSGKTALFAGAFPNDGSTRIGTQLLFLEDDGDRQVLGLLRIPPNSDYPNGVSSLGVLADEVRLTSTNAAFGLTLGAVNGGAVTLVGDAGVRITHSTTGASANCFIDPSDGRIWRSTSSRRYKQDIEDAEADPQLVLQLRGRTWRDKGEVEADPDTERRYVGFIAEELHDLGLTQFVVYDADGRPDAISYDRLAVALVALARDQQTQLEDLAARVTALEEA